MMADTARKRLTIFKIRRADELHMHFGTRGAPRASPAWEFVTSRIMQTAMASISDIQALLSTMLEQQNSKMEAQLALRDDTISKLMEHINLKDTPQQTGKKKKAGGQTVQSESSQSNRTPINKGKASTSQGLGTPKSPTPAESNRPSPLKPLRAKKVPLLKRK
ncbi:hypothetical protein H4Q26_005139 [Puccinia striiformis f. sp. tritici PST-130]|nr:hypothetical protein H4Q26_005139 [Puccinia striiformis f. sp. tritici PST-130]